MWRQQLHALIEANSASPHTDIDWQVYLLQWTIPRGQPGAERREVDTERIAEWLRDPEPFCDRLSTWSGFPATRLRLAADIDRQLTLSEAPCTTPEHWTPDERQGRRRFGLLRRHAPPRRTPSRWAPGDAPPTPLPQARPEFRASTSGPITYLSTSRGQRRLANFLTVPALLPRARGEPCPPCVDVEVKWEPGSSTSVYGNAQSRRHNGHHTPPA